MQQNRAVSIRSCSAYSVKLVTREQRVLFRIPYNMAGTFQFYDRKITKHLCQTPSRPPLRLALDQKTIVDCIAA